MMFVLIVCVWVLLGVILAVRWDDDSPLTEYELVRRSSAGNRDARELLEHRRRRPLLDVLRQIFVTLLSSAIVTLSVVTFGRWPGIVTGTLLLILVPALLRLPLVRRGADWLQQRAYPQAARVSDRLGKAFDLLRARDRVHHRARIYSKPELLDIIHNSHGVLTDREAERVRAGLAFGDKSVADVMTPAANVVTAEASDTLGPLVMHDLHSSGHDCFPVVDGSLADVVGVLDLQRHVGMKTDSRTVRELMEVEIVKIPARSGLDDTLRLFADRPGIILVADDDDGVIGLLSLSDVVGALTGDRPDE